MGYIFVLILGAVVIVGLLVAFMSGRKRAVGQTGRADDMTVKAPSAEQPTPGASSTASPGKSDTAQRHTPPA
jgi:hypothetical protein